jgi:hypothetical protein
VRGPTLVLTALVIALVLAAPDGCGRADAAPPGVDVTVEVVP